MPRASQNQVKSRVLVEREILINALKAICANYPQNSNAFNIAFQSLLSIGIRYER